MDKRTASKNRYIQDKDGKTKRISINKSIKWYIQYAVLEFILAFCQSCAIYNMLYWSSSWLFVNHVIYTICYTGVHPGFLSIMWYIQFIKWLWIFLILIGLEGSLLPLTELHVHRAILRARLINLTSQLVRTQI